MAYLVSQIRKNNNQAYMEKLHVIETVYESKEPSDKIKFLKIMQWGLIMEGNLN